MKRMPRKYARKASSLKTEAPELQFSGSGTSRSDTNSTRGKKKRVIGSDSNARTIVASNPFDDDHNHHHPAHQVHQYQPPLPHQIQHPPHHMHHQQHHHHSPAPMTPTGMQGSPYSMNQVPPPPPMHHQAAQQQYQPHPHPHPHQQHQHPMPPHSHPPHQQHQMGPMGPHGPIRAPPPPHHMIEVAPYPQQVMSPTPPPPQPPPGSRPHHNVYGFQGYAISSPPPQQQASVPHKAPIMHQMEPPGQSPMQPPYPQGQHHHQPLQPQQQQQQPYNTMNNIYCGKCQREFYQNEPNIICKAGCRSSFHIPCSGLSELACDLLMKESFAEWACDRCTSGNGCVPLVKYKA